MPDRIAPIAHAPGADLWAWGWLTHSDPAVRAHLLELARAHGWDPNAIAAVILRESAGDPQAVNPTSGASGLIQFMPETAKALGSSIGAVRRMNAVEQLDLVEQYLVRVFAQMGKPREVGDYYVAVFWPAAIGKPDETELGHPGNAVYDQNRALDVDGSGVLTAGDVKQAIRREYAARSGTGAIVMAAPAIGAPPRCPFGRAPSARRGWAVAGVLVVASGLGWIGWRRSHSQG